MTIPNPEISKPKQFNRQPHSYDHIKITKFLIYMYIIGLVIYGVFFFRTEKNPNLTGIVEANVCDYEKLKQTNDIIKDKLNELTQSTFFRYFKVQLEKDCPFWAQNLMCTGEGNCNICTCDDNQIPISWKKNPKTDLILNSDMKQNYFDSAINFLDEEQTCWHCKDIDDGDNAVYVDIQQNLEIDSGYDGSKIWEIIYKENCFQGEKCLEEKMLYKIISGFHTSVSTQVSNYQKNKRPSYTKFFNKVGNYPERIQNLYFLFSVMLRSINIASNRMKQFYIDTGDHQSDTQVKQQLYQILNETSQFCTSPFKEDEIFQDYSKKEIRKQFQKYLYNISKILDCVECEKCKLNSKLQVYGIATALKIMFFYKDFGDLPQIKRNEFIALINTFHKVSKSIEFIDKFYQQRYRHRKDLLPAIFAPFGLAILFLFCALKVINELPNRVRQKFRFMAQYKQKFENLSKEEKYQIARERQQQHKQQSVVSDPKSKKDN